MEFFTILPDEHFCDFDGVVVIQISFYKQRLYNIIEVTISPNRQFGFSKNTCSKQD